MAYKKKILPPLYGAFKLLFFEPRGIAFFSSEKQAARRSFLVPLFMFPFLIFMISFLRQGDLVNLPVHSFVMTYTAGLFFGIGAYYFLVHIFLEMLYPDKQKLYPLYITCFNWSFAIQTIFLISPVLAYGIGLLSAPVASMALLLFSTLFYVYKWYITRIALDMHWGWSIGLVIVQSALGDFFTIMMFATVLRGSGG